jgi:RNA polymerase sigma-70 factor (ECF subfamily)
VQVRHVLAELSDQEAKLLLGRADGCSYRELADLLDIKPASVGTMLARAEKRFQQKFEDCYGKQ